MNCEECGELLPEHEIALRKCGSCRMRDQNPLSSMTDDKLASLLQDSRGKITLGQEADDENLELAGKLEVDLTIREIGHRITDRRRLGLSEGFEGVL